MNTYLNHLLQTEDVSYIFAADTDSLYITLDDLVKKTYNGNLPDHKEIVKFLDKVCDGPLQKVIDDSYTELAEYMNANQKMFMKREAIADKGIWLAKKRYLLNVHNNEGVAYDTPKLKAMGVESVKSSTPGWCRDKIKACFQIIMNKDNSNLIAYIDQCKQDFYKLNPDEIAFPRSVQNLKKYQDTNAIYSKGTPIHVRGSLLYNNLLTEHKISNKYQVIKEGEKIKFMYLTIPNIIGENVIAFPDVLPAEFELHEYIDYETQFQKTFLDPIVNICTVIEWDVEKKITLDDLFG